MSNSTKYGVVSVRGATGYLTPLLVGGLLFMQVPSAFAELGGSPFEGNEPHVVSTSRAPHVTSRVLSAAAYAASSVGSQPVYSVNTVTMDSGTVVHEFVNTATNEVFVVTWNGPRLPHLRQVLGQYFSRFAAGAGAISAGPAQRGLTSSDLVVRSYGHMGNFSGSAYLPARVPNGVAISDLR